MLRRISQAVDDNGCTCCEIGISPPPAVTDGYTEDFHDVVDGNDPHSNEKRTGNLFIKCLIESLPFKLGILLAIVVNSIIVVLQTDEKLETHYGAFLLGLDKFFLTIFILEILIKWYYDFLGFWKVGWNVFDFVIVSLAFLVPGVAFLSGTRILHVLTVLRAIRSLQSISALRGLQIVIQTVTRSIPDVVNITALLLISMFIFAILGHTLFGNNCLQYFGSLERTMFSLFICVTQDGWVDIVEELNECGSPILGPIYLVVFITVGAFILANLVVAVVVTNLEWIVGERNEMEKKLVIPNEDVSRPELTNVYTDLTDVTSKEVPLKLNYELLEHYRVLISSLNDNFSEFKKIKKELMNIQQEVEALEILDEVSNEELLELSEGIHPQRSQASIKRKFKSHPRGSHGDVISELISISDKGPSQATSIHHMISHLELVDRVPSGQLITRRNSSHVGEHFLEPTIISRSPSHSSGNRPSRNSIVSITSTVHSQ